MALLSDFLLLVFPTSFILSLISCSCLCSMMNALSEGLTLAENSGLSQQTLLDVLVRNRCKFTTWKNVPVPQYWHNTHPPPPPPPSKIKKPTHTHTTSLPPLRSLDLGQNIILILECLWISIDFWHCYLSALGKSVGSENF